VSNLKYMNCIFRFALTLHHSYDYDTDPVKRKETPDFYGYIPDEGIARPLLLVCMTLNSALLLLARAFSAAMLMLVSKRYLAIYLAGDMALYLLQKVVRGDFHYWTPVDGVFGLFLSLTLRVAVKTVTDVTGLIQFRHPLDLGGYWTVNMFLALLASFVRILWRRWSSLRLTRTRQLLRLRSEWRGHWSGL